MITEDRVILAITEQFFKDSDVTQSQFAVESLYPVLKKSGLIRERDVSSVDEFLKEQANLKTQISTIMKGKVRFPLEWKWCWIACLPSPYREQCINELKVFIPGILPSETAGQPAIADVGRLSVEFGEAIQATAPIAADGVYDEFDDPEKVTIALNELYDLRDQTQAQIEAIEAGTGVTVPRSGCAGLEVMVETSVTLVPKNISLETAE